MLNRRHMIYLALSTAVAVGGCSKADNKSGDNPAAPKSTPSAKSAKQPAPSSAQLSQLIDDLRTEGKRDAAVAKLKAAGNSVAPAFAKSIATGLTAIDTAPAKKQFDAMMALDPILEGCIAVGESCFPALKQVILRKGPVMKTLCGTKLPSGYICQADGSIKATE